MTTLEDINKHPLGCNEEKFQHGHQSVDCGGGDKEEAGGGEKDMKDGKDGKDVGDCLDGKFGGVGMEIRLVALPIEVEVTRIENKAHSQREEHLYKSASNHDGHGGDEGDELEEG